MAKKIKGPSIKIEIPSYWEVSVYDYHFFDEVATSLKTVGIKVNYWEVGFDGSYRAIFWIKGTKKPTKVIKDRIAELDVDY